MAAHHVLCRAQPLAAAGSHARNHPRAGEASRSEEKWIAPSLAAQKLCDASRFAEEGRVSQHPSEVVNTVVHEGLG